MKSNYNMKKKYENNPVEYYNQVATEYLESFKTLNNLNEKQLEVLYNNVINKIEEQQQVKKLN